MLMPVDSYNCSVQLINEEDFRPVGHFRRRSIVVIRHTPVIIGEPAAALGWELHSLQSVRVTGVGVEVTILA